MELMNNKNLVIFIVIFFVFITCSGCTQNNGEYFEFNEVVVLRNPSDLEVEIIKWSSSEVTVSIKNIENHHCFLNTNPAAALS